MHLTRHFFIFEGRLYRKGDDLQHKLVVPKDQWMYILKAAHDALGHRGVYATTELIGLRFWWPAFQADVKWYVQTCDTCQKRQALILRPPPVITHTPSIFQVLYVDTVEMTPASNQCKHVLHGRCGLSSWPEARAVRRDTAKNIAKWLFEDIITRWGCLHTIVTDNAKQYKSAVAWLRRLYGIEGITISPYNSKANAQIERPHKDLREALAKAAKGQLSKWFWYLPHVLWADRITVRRRFGVSPFFLVTGAHPTIPLDILEATWLVKLPDRMLTRGELIGYRARALIKHRADVLKMQRNVHEEKVKRLMEFDKKHQHLTHEFKFKFGDLVLIRNSAIEKSLDRKMYNRWFGPCIVLRQSKGGAYICADLDGTVIGERIARDRVIPYMAREKIEIPTKLENWIDISRDALRSLSSDPETRLYKDPTDLMKEVGLPGQNLTQDELKDIDQEEEIGL